MRTIGWSGAWAMVALAGACGGREGGLRIAGTIEIREISVAPLTDGRLLALVKDEGDTVALGDTIAILTQPGLDDRIAELAARYEAARARVRDLRAGARPQELDAARAALERAVADSARTAIEAHRVSNLYEAGAAAAAEWDAARTTAEAAGARVKEARETLHLLEAGARPDEVTVARREAEAAAAALAQAEATRAELVLRAPADGIILLRLAERGEVIRSGAPVVTLGLTREPWVRAFVGQADIARVRLGAPVRLDVAGYADGAFAGRVSEINPEAEFTPRAALTEEERADLVFGIKVAIDDAGGRLKSGMPVDLLIELAP